jgi:hypothetical protein
MFACICGHDHDQKTDPCRHPGCRCAEWETIDEDVPEQGEETGRARWRQMPVPFHSQKT